MRKPGLPIRLHIGRPTGSRTPTERQRSTVSARIPVWCAGLLMALVTVGCGEAPTLAPPPPTDSEAPTPVPPKLEAADTEFGRLIRLEDARLLARDVRPGGQLGVQLTWHLLRPTRRDLTVVARLLDVSGRTRARRDARIGGADVGTSRWPPHATLTDEVVLPLSELLEPGRYELAVAVVDAQSGIQVPVTAEGGLPPVLVASQQILGAVHVAPAGN